MTKQTQKEAVFTAVKNVLAEENVTISDNTNVNDLMTKERRAQVNSILFEGFKNGSIEITELPDDSALKGYVSGLQSNWLRKDKRLNGGIGYVAKNPGSRAGSGDASLKAMRALLTSVSTEAEKTEIQGYIDARLTELKVSKIKTVSIDFSALPADLQSKFAK